MYRLTTAVLSLALFATGCTRTIYVVRGADGGLEEIAPPQAPDPSEARADGLRIELNPVADFVHSDAEGPVYVEIRVEGEATADLEPARVDLALVIDRSGSMRGEKLRHAKDAAHALVDELRPGDRVAIVSYATDVRVDLAAMRIDERSVQRAHRAIDRLRASGRTFLSGGLRAGGAEVLRAVHRTGAHRAVVLSDGRANVGASRPHELERLASTLYDQGVTVTTMGVGLDYNEDVMTSMAVAGGGQYYFIERSERLAGVLTSELESMRGLVARDVVLELELPAGVRLREVHGYAFQRTARGASVRLSSIALGQTRRVVAALDVDHATIAGRRPEARAIANARLRYALPRSGEARSMNPGPARVTYTTDRARAAASVNREVAEKVELVRNARARQEAMRLMDAGRTDDARRVVQQRMKQTQRARQVIGGARLGAEADSLQSLDRELRSAPSAASPQYRRMRKSRMSEAYELSQ